MQIIPANGHTAIPDAIHALTRGELVIYPTETCYGIAADATNPAAVTQLLAYKGDRHRQVAIAVSSKGMAEKYVRLNEMAENLYTHFLPGPLTVISESLHQVDSRLESAQGTLGIRFPNHPFALELIKQFGKPITATSANTSGKKEPYSLADWQKYTTPNKQEMISLFLDAGRLVERPTSTVVDTTLNDPTVLRQGEFILPTASPTFTSHSPEQTQQFAATLLHRHLNLSHRFPLVFALQGDLGAGKTQFSKGLAHALEIDETVASPTYTLLHEYPYVTDGKGIFLNRNSRLQTEKGSTAGERRIPNGHHKYSGIFYHIDTWRLADPTELESTLHMSALLQPGNIISIEWAGKAKNLLETYRNSCTIIIINIKELNESTREISYTFTTPEWT